MSDILAWEGTVIGPGTGYGQRYVFKEGRSDLPMALLS